MTCSGLVFVSSPEQRIECNPASLSRSRLSCDPCTRRGHFFDSCNRMKTMGQQQDFWKTCGRRFRITRQVYVLNTAAGRPLNRYRWRNKLRFMLRAPN